MVAQPMTAAAVQGTFAGYRIVAGRKVCVLYIEIPMECTDEAVRALGGTPMPDDTRWVAIARIHDPARPATRGAAGGAGAASSSPSFDTLPAADVPTRRWEDLSPVKQAGIRCRDVRFQEWLGVHSADEAAEIVRTRCGVSSRSKIDATPETLATWYDMDADFTTWMFTQGREDFLR